MEIKQITTSGDHLFLLTDTGVVFKVLSAKIKLNQVNTLEDMIKKSTNKVEVFGR